MIAALVSIVSPRAEAQDTWYTVSGPIRYRCADQATGAPLGSGDGTFAFDVSWDTAAPAWQAPKVQLGLKISSSIAASVGAREPASGLDGRWMLSPQPAATTIRNPGRRETRIDPLLRRGREGLPGQ